MDFNKAHQYLLSRPSALEDYPFGPEVMVFKVEDKMFATLSRDHGEGRMNLKCDPEQALALRDIFPAVIPGYHMNKRHWNTVVLDGSIPTGEIERMIDHSYGLVVKSLKKGQRNALELKYGASALYRE
ncbi:MmcQ/YjbR family DNA-binding protein [Hahella ganghwensis]|uniref:MmcQ/YjbR family DNA-binding protein n=1 Tax=Hahella ganghwensis TaxID=286420 RepID=UPI000378094B|nr:MmcQ/YjbR family DNA-binding protein [Hahella ganghwensis]